MPVSPKKLAANRANSKKSTGPKTPSGKQKSSQNALRHGLRASNPVLAIESQDDFLALHQSFLDEFNPRTPLAHSLVEQLAALQWRLRRIDSLEAGLLDDCYPPGRANRPEFHTRAEVNAFQAQGLRDSKDAQKQFDSFSRHYSRLKRAFDRTLAQLLQLNKTNNLQQPVASFVEFPTADIAPPIERPKPLKLGPPMAEMESSRIYYVDEHGRNSLDRRYIVEDEPDLLSDDEAA
jgi:hypothetical protein